MRGVLMRCARLSVVLSLGAFLAVAGASCKKQDSAEANSQSNPQQAPKAAELDPPANAPTPFSIDGKQALEYVKAFVAIGPRPLGSGGHKKAEEFLITTLQNNGAQVESDSFTQPTPAGVFPMRNISAKYPGKKDGVIVIAGHYDTNLPLKDKNFVGANDGGSSTGLMLEISRQLKGTTLEGYGIWLVFTDGEEATIQWSPNDSLFGSKHLAQKWQQDGTAKKVKAFLLLDMIGDKDLNIDGDSNSTPWLEEVVYRAAQRQGVQSKFFVRTLAMDDDHLPFKSVGVPVVDIIDFDYGLDNVFHHTTEDTIDKLSAESLQIVGNVVAESVRALNTR